MFADLSEVLNDFLPAVPRLGARLAALSASSLDLPPSRIPHWLALRQVELKWKLHLRDQGGSKRFLFIPIGMISSRDRLDATVAFSVVPRPRDPVRAAPNKNPAIMVELPRALDWRRDGVLAFEFPDEHWEISPPSTHPDLFEDDFAESIGIERWPGGGPLANGKNQTWPLGSFVDFAAALARNTASGGGHEIPMTSLLPDPGHGESAFWRLLAEFSGSIASGRAALEALDPIPTPLPTRWEAAHVLARLGILVNPNREVALPGAADTYLVPADLRLPDEIADGQARASVGFPDFLLAGPFRASLARVFARQRAVIKAASELGLPAGELDQVLAEDRRAVFLRVDRRPNNDEVLLVLEGKLGGMRAAALLHSNVVTYSDLSSPDGPTATIKDVKSKLDPSLLSTPMRWGQGKQLFCDLLHGLMRWRLLVQPQRP